MPGRADTRVRLTWARQVPEKQCIPVTPVAGAGTGERGLYTAYGVYRGRALRRRQGSY